MNHEYVIDVWWMSDGSRQRMAMTDKSLIGVRPVVDLGFCWDPGQWSLSSNGHWHLPWWMTNILCLISRLIWQDSSCSCFLALRDPPCCCWAQSYCARWFAVICFLVCVQSLGDPCDLSRSVAIVEFICSFQSFAWRGARQEGVSNLWRATVLRVYWFTS